MTRLSINLRLSSESRDVSMGFYTYSTDDSAANSGSSELHSSTTYFMEISRVRVRLIAISYLM